MGPITGRADGKGGTEKDKRKTAGRRIKGQTWEEEKETVKSWRIREVAKETDWGVGS